MYLCRRRSVCLCKKRSVCLFKKRSVCLFRKRRGERVCLEDEDAKKVGIWKRRCKKAEKLVGKHRRAKEAHFLIKPYFGALEFTGVKLPASQGAVLTACQNAQCFSGEAS